RRGTGPAPLRPDSDASAAPAARRPAFARPAAHPAARSRPAEPSAATAPDTALAAHSRHARTSPPAAPRPPRRTHARRAYPPPNQRQRSYPSVLLRVGNRFTAPRPGGTVAEPHRQGPQRGYVLLPLVGTSPPPGDASPLWALHTGHGLLALPGGGRGNDRMTYGVSNYSSVHT